MKLRKFWIKFKGKSFSLHIFCQFPCFKSLTISFSFKGECIYWEIQRCYNEEGLNEKKRKIGTGRKESWENTSDQWFCLKDRIFSKTTYIKVHISFSRINSNTRSEKYTPVNLRKFLNRDICPASGSTAIAGTVSLKPGFGP